MSRVHIGVKLRHLTPSSLESALLGSKAYTQRSHGWTDAAKRQGLLVDISRVEWFELGAVVQLILFIENAARSGVEVDIALPLPKQRLSELGWMQRNPELASAVRHRIIRRQQANAFLQYLQFESALSDRHLGSAVDCIRILREYDLSQPFDQSDEDFDGFSLDNPESSVPEEYLYKYVLPITWVSPEWPSTLPNLHAFLGSVIGDPRRGLEVIDARSITNVILHELIQNVEQHSKSMSPALLAAWARPGSLAINPQQFLESERPYLNWVSEKQTSLVEIVLGDSGRGVVEVLGESFRERMKFSQMATIPKLRAQVMLWAFDRWSSSNSSIRRRGTRGLYRVDRIVKKYQGLVTMRSANQFVGIDHGGPSYDNEFIYPAKLAYIPGTILRLRIPPFRDSAPMRPTIVGDATPTVHVIGIGQIGPDGLSTSAQRDLQRLLDSAPPAFVVAVPDANRTPQLWTEQALRQATELRHPGALVLYDSLGDWDTLENAIDSVNAEHEAQHRGAEAHAAEHYEIWDPVLVVGGAGRFGWVGTDAASRTALDALTQEGGKLTQRRLEELLPEPLQRAAFLLAVRNDTSFFAFTDNGELQLRFAFNQVSNAIADTVAAQLAQHVARGFPGVLESGPFLAPSLQLRTLWIDVEQLLNSSTSSNIAMLALAIRIRSHGPLNGHLPPSILIGDSGSLHSNLAMLQSHLGVPRRETPPAWTDIPVTTGVRVLERGTSVLLFFDVIATGESARREIRRILREEGRPVAVACIIDARPVSEEQLTVWDISVPVISLMRAPSLLDASIVSNARVTSYINPITGRPEELKEEQCKPGYVITPEKIEEKIEDFNALHFTHVGRPLGRHFTFYLDATRFLRDSPVTTMFNRTIDEWIAQDQTGLKPIAERGIEIWYAEPEPKPSEPARRFVETLQRQRTDVVRVQALTRYAAYGHLFFGRKDRNPLQSSNVIVVDWGALTGATITQAIRMGAEAGAQRILVCVFLSQLSLDEEAFLRSLQRVVGRRAQRFSNTTPMLPGFEPIEELDSGNREVLTSQGVEVAVHFLSRFPIDNYDQHQCPVCEQLQRLSQETYPTELLANFAQEQRTVHLRLRSREELLDSPPRDFQDRELTGAYVVVMARIRRSLVESLRSTRERWELRNYVLKVRDTLLQTSDPQSGESTAFIHFLAVETQWLRRPPLHLAELRDAIADIALGIALQNSNTIPERLNGIIVLRTAAKDRFAREFFRIFLDVSHSRELVQQLLYDAFTYIARPYHQSASVLKPLRDQLRLAKGAVDSEAVVLETAISYTLSALEIRANTEVSKADVRSISVPEVWARLREILGSDYADHDPVDESILLMQPGLDAALVDRAVSNSDINSGLRELPPEVIRWLQGIAQHWRRCQVFLDYTVLPLLVRIRHIIRSHEGKRALGAEAAAKIDGLLADWDRTRPIAESPFSKLVATLSRVPEGELSEQMWREYKSECQWLREAVLKARTHREPGSRMIEFLLSLPSVLATEINEGIADIKHQLSTAIRIFGIDELPAELSVFCPRELIRDTIRELVLNAQKRASEASTTVDIWLSVIIREERVILWVRNSGTEPKSQDSGYGLRRLSSRLEAFDGTLKAEPRPVDSRYSFEVEIELLLAR